MVEKLSIRQHTGRGTDKERREKKRGGKGMASQRMLAIISGVQARLRVGGQELRKERDEPEISFT